MDTQLKKGLLEACVLTCLSIEESYGYKIITDISPYIVISESTLYPILKRLEATKSLTVRTKEHNGRLRKYYMITQEGKIKLKDFKQDIKELDKVYKYISIGGEL